MKFIEVRRLKRADPYPMSTRTLMEMMTEAERELLTLMHRDNKVVTDYKPLEWIIKTYLNDDVIESIQVEAPNWRYFSEFQRDLRDVQRKIKGQFTAMDLFHLCNKLAGVIGNLAVHLSQGVDTPRIPRPLGRRNQ